MQSCEKYLLRESKQYFHTDGADLVGLLCIARALEGGESDIVSTHHVFNTLQRENPEVLETLCTPNWYFDRKGEVSDGEDPWYKSSIVSNCGVAIVDEMLIQAKDVPRERNEGSSGLG